MRLAEDGWNTTDAAKVALAYTPDTRWRNRATSVNHRAKAEALLTAKWIKELDDRLMKELWAFTDNRIAVRYAYGWHDDSGNWFRSYGNENWEFAENGRNRNEFPASTMLPIKEEVRLFHWSLGRRSYDHPGLARLRSQRFGCLRVQSRHRSKAASFRSCRYKAEVYRQRVLQTSSFICSHTILNQPRRYDL